MLCIFEISRYFLVIAWVKRGMPTKMYVIYLYLIIVCAYLILAFKIYLCLSWNLLLGNEISENDFFKCEAYW